MNEPVNYIGVEEGWDLRRIFREIPHDIPLHDEIPEGQLLRSESFVCLGDLGEVWDPEADLLEICLRGLPRLELLGLHPRGCELQIIQGGTPGYVEVLRDPLGRLILQDIVDLPFPSEDLQVLLGNTTDLLADPGVLRRNL